MKVEDNKMENTKKVSKMEVVSGHKFMKGNQGNEYIQKLISAQ